MPATFSPGGSAPALLSHWPSSESRAQAPSHSLAWGVRGAPPGGHTNHVVSSDLPPTLGCCHGVWRAGPRSRHQFRKHPALPSPYLPLDQNRGGGVWCHRDETWRLSQTCNTRKKKVRITWFCLYLAASLEICSHLLQSPCQPCGL